MDGAKRLIFTFNSTDEKEFIRVEAAIRKYVDADEAVPSKLVKQLLDLLYSKENNEIELEEAYNDLNRAYLVSIKHATITYFQSQPVYWFKEDETDMEYSLAAWLNIFFEEIKYVRVDGRKTKGQQRTAFINFIAHSLYAYICGMKNPPDKKKYKTFVVAGYISAMFGHLIHPTEFDPTRYNYDNYNAYLYDTVRGVIKGI